MAKITKRSMKKLKASLMVAISGWLDSSVDEKMWGKEWDAWIAEDADELMTNAAFSVLEGIKSVQVYLSEQGHLEG